MSEAFDVFLALLGRTMVMPLRPWCAVAPSVAESGELASIVLAVPLDLASAEVVLAFLVFDDVFVPTLDSVFIAPVGAFASAAFVFAATVFPVGFAEDFFGAVVFEADFLAVPVLVTVFFAVLFAVTFVVFFVDFFVDLVADGLAFDPPVPAFLETFLVVFLVTGFVTDVVAFFKAGFATFFFGTGFFVADFFDDADAVAFESGFFLPATGRAGAFETFSPGVPVLRPFA